MLFFSPLDQFYVFPLAHMPKIVDYTFFTTEYFSIYKIYKVLSLPYKVLPTFLGILATERIDIPESPAFLEQEAHASYLLGVPFLNLLWKFSFNEFFLDIKGAVTLNQTPIRDLAHFAFRETSTSFLDLSGAFKNISKGEARLQFLGFGDLNLWLEAFLSTNVPEEVMNAFSLLKGFHIKSYQEAGFPDNFMNGAVEVTDATSKAFLLRELPQLVFHAKSMDDINKICDYVEHMDEINRTVATVARRSAFEMSAIVSMLNDHKALDDSFVLHEQPKEAVKADFFGLFVYANIFGPISAYYGFNNVASLNQALHCVLDPKWYFTHETSTDSIMQLYSKIRHKSFLDDGHPLRRDYTPGATFEFPANPIFEEPTVFKKVRYTLGRFLKSWYQGIVGLITDQPTAFSVMLSARANSRESWGGSITPELLTGLQNFLIKFLYYTPRVFSREISSTETFPSQAMFRDLVENYYNQVKATDPSNEVALDKIYNEFLYESFSITDTFVRDMLLYTTNTWDMFKRLLSGEVLSLDVRSHADQFMTSIVDALRVDYTFKTLYATKNLPLHGNEGALQYVKDHKFSMVNAALISETFETTMERDFFSKFGIFERISFNFSVWYNEKIASLFGDVRSSDSVYFTVFNPYYKNPVANLWMAVQGTSLTIFGLIALTSLVSIMYFILFFDWRNSMVKGSKHVLNEGFNDVKDFTYSHYLFSKGPRAFAEDIYRMLLTMTLNNIQSTYARYFFPTIYLTFHLVLFCNLYGMLPGSFTFTSLFVITFTISFWLFVSLNIIGVIHLRTGFFGLFMPQGVPTLLIPFLVVLETISYVFRVISVSVRLFANMMAGHTLLKVLTTFVVKAVKGASGVSPVFALIPMVFGILLLLAIWGLEIAVAFIQAYVFTVLFTVYINDALHGGH